MILKVGITGGMGSGKSTVAKIFKVFGIPIYNADDAAKRLMNEDPEIITQLQDLFGIETYINGQLNRKYLSNIVFNNVEKLALLNSVVHPATIKDANEWMAKQTSPYALKEAALIFESGAQQKLDCVIGVSSPLSFRIQRIMKRDSITKEEIKARIEKQMDESQKMDLCDYVVINNDELLIVPQVIKIHEILLAKSLSSQTTAK